MKAMVLNEIREIEEGRPPLVLTELPDPVPASNEVLVRVSACGVCHTELDEIEGRMDPPRLPVVPGHQVVGRVEAAGEQCHRFSLGDRVGIAWIYFACGECRFCREGSENLCSDFLATGRDADGGYAEYMTVPEMFAYPVPDCLGDAETAPLLCAGAIGYRSLSLTGMTDGQSLGLTGFGASAHLVLKMAAHQYPNSDVIVFARNPKERAFALELGAVWSGDTDEEPPEKLHAVIDTTPAWKPVVEALSNLEPGGRLVVNAIRKEAGDLDYLLKMDYPEHLWMEKEIKSVANVTRRDVSEFLALAAEMRIRPEVEVFQLDAANEALIALRKGKIRGAKVLRLG